MENTRENKLSMFRKTETYLTLRALALSLVPGIADAALRFSDNLAEIIDNATDSDADLTGFTQSKKQAREDLEKSIYVVAGAGSIYYTKVSPDAGNKKLLTFSLSDLQRERDTDLYVIGKRVSDLTTDIKASLIIYGVPANDYNLFENRLSAYYASLQLPRSKQGESSAALKEIDRLIKANDLLLEEEIDVMMRYFKINNAELHDEYLVARSIDDTGGSGNGSVLATFEGNIAAGTVVNFGEIPADAKTFVFENKGIATLEIGGSNDGVNIDGNSVAIGGVGKESIKKADLNTNGTQLILRNQTTSIAGSYKVQILG